MQAIRLHTVLLMSIFFSATASAQVFDSGPSDPALFQNVFNVPEDVLPSRSNISGNVDSPTQVNLANGGSLLGGAQALGVELNISGGSVPSGLLATGSEINISGGSIGNNARITGGREFTGFGGSVVNITGGEVGQGFEADDDTVVNISGGLVGSISAEDNSVVNISGGSVNNRVIARGGAGSVVNISGGSVGQGLDNRFRSVEVQDGSVVNISGGSFGTGVSAGAGSTVNLFGSNFALGGVLLDDLVLGEAFTITDRDLTLSGLLDDGSAVSFDLTSGNVSVPLDNFSSTATLTVTLTSVPEPSSLAVLLLGCGLAGMRRRRSAAFPF